MAESSTPPGLSPATAARRFGHYLLVAVTLLVTSLLALAAQALVAYYFGAAEDSDALFLARDISQSAAKLLLPTQAAGVLVPTFLALNASRGREAWDVLAALIWTVLLIATPVVVLTVAFAPALVTVFAPGFADAATDEAVGLLRIFAPTMWFVLAGSLATAVLQGRERFGRAMLANVTGAGALVVALPLLVPALEIDGAAIAFLVGAAVQGVVAWVLLVVEGMPGFRSPRRYGAEAREFVRKLTPMLAYAGATQVSGATIRITASFLSTGVFTALAIARQLNIALYTLIFVPLNTVLFPALSQHAVAGREADLQTELRASIRYVIYLVTPVSVLIVVLREPTVSLLFERGEFSDEDTRNTAIAMSVYAGGLILTGLVLLLEQAAFARERLRLVVGTNVRLEAVQTATVPLLALTLGVGGIPLAGILAAGVGTWLYWRQLAGDGPGTPPGLRRRFLVRVAAGALVLAAVTALASAGLDAVVDPGPGIEQAAIVVPAAAVGLAAYLATTTLLGLRELPLLANVAGERLGRRRGL